MSKKRFVVAVSAAILMSPVIVLGILFYALSAYFLVGMDIAEELAPHIDKALG